MKTKNGLVATGLALAAVAVAWNGREKKGGTTFGGVIFIDDSEASKLPGELLGAAKLLADSGVSALINWQLNATEHRTLVSGKKGAIVMNNFIDGRPRPKKGWPSIAARAKALLRRDAR